MGLMGSVYENACNPPPSEHILAIADLGKALPLNEGGSTLLRKTVFFAFLLTVAYSGWLLPRMRAQQTTGSILGTVEDAQGAVVVGAQVTAQNSETGLS